MTRDEIRNILLAAGYTIKPGETDLRPYVYEAAQQLIEAEREACARLAEQFPANRAWVPGSLWANIRAEVAADIRARNKPFSPTAL